MDHELDLEISQKELELLKVSTSKAEMYFTIKQKQAEVRRTQGHIKIQEDKEAELKKKIEELKAKLASSAE